MLTIVDNIVDSLTTRFAKLHDRKHCCTFVTTFFLMVAVICLGLLMTTRVTNKNNSFEKEKNVSCSFDLFIIMNLSKFLDSNHGAFVKTNIICLCVGGLLLHYSFGPISDQIEIHHGLHSGCLRYHCIR